MHPPDNAMGTMEVDSSGASSSQGTAASPPRRQVSNLSMPVKKSGLCGTSSNLANSIVGAGIIGIPYAFRQSGIVAGVFLLLVVAYCTGT
jgi:sodium-coupled neutral amino acid transporter 11